MSSPVFTRSREVPRAMRELPQTWRREVPVLYPGWWYIAAKGALVGGAIYGLLFIAFILWGGK